MYVSIYIYIYIYTHTHYIVIAIFSRLEELDTAAHLLRESGPMIALKQELRIILYIIL